MKHPDAVQVLDCSATRKRARPSKVLPGAANPKAPMRVFPEEGITREVYMSCLDEWTALAPKPAPQSDGETWDVFLSYRSVERAWVLSLYDSLRRLGYRVFMDQFVLAASEQLPIALSKGLQNSRAGILVWSSRNEDSAWCMSEYAAFENLEKQKGFRYVIAKLDGAPLPALAAAKLWVDFSEAREGPRGSSLLKLLYGLHGQPLPEDAVRLATEVDEEVKRSLARIRAARDDQDSGRIRQSAGSEHLAWRTSSLLGCACAEALISVGAADAALPVLDDLEGRFPKDLRPRQLRGLALARLKRWQDAKAVLGELYELGERDPETVGIYARTWMDSYEATGNDLHLRRSRNLYAEAFQATPSDYYTGINAAAKSVFLDELDAAAEFAAQVEKLVGQPQRNDYWMNATVAEVQLIRRQYADAARLYRAAVESAPGREGDHASTWKQARRLMAHLKPAPSEEQEIARAFAHLPAEPLTHPGSR